MSIVYDNKRIVVMEKVLALPQAIKTAEESYFAKAYLRDIREVIALVVYETVKVVLKAPFSSSQTEKIRDSDLYKQISFLIHYKQICLGDLRRPSSWGLKNDSLVLLDYGLTETIFDKHYCGIA